MIYEKKCPQCETVNFSQAPLASCAQCKAPLYTVAAHGVPALPGLAPCEDCRIPISRMAESCPYCGRSDRKPTPEGPERGRAWWVATILLALSIFAGVLYAGAVISAVLLGER